MMDVDKTNSREEARRALAAARAKQTPADRLSERAGKALDTLLARHERNHFADGFREIIQRGRDQ